MIKCICYQFKNYSETERKIALRGLALLETFLNSEECKQGILTANFSSTNGMKNADIYKLLMSGADMYDKREDGIINFSFTMYYRWWSKVVGYVTSGDRTIYTNRKFFSTAENFASNALHEYMHLIGFSHRSANEITSIPYKMNQLFEEWAR